MNDKTTLGLIYNNHFYQIIINKKSMIFKENIKPMVSRLPKELIFSMEDEGNIVLVDWEKTSEGEEPIIKEVSGVLPAKALELLVNSQVENCSFYPLTVGGSVNHPIN